MFLLGILIFKGLTARRLYKSFGVKGLICSLYTGGVVAAPLLTKPLYTGNLSSFILAHKSPYGLPTGPTAVLAHSKNIS
jgi:hypothetical protein